MMTPRMIARMVIDRILIMEAAAGKLRISSRRFIYDYQIKKTPQIIIILAGATIIIFLYPLITDHREHSNIRAKYGQTKRKSMEY